MMQLSQSRLSNTNINKYNTSIRQEFDVIGFIDGHTKTHGKDAHIIKNPIWIVKDNDKELLFMFCEPNELILLCRQSYERILDFEKENSEKLTWYKAQNGYIASKTHSKHIYIHQLIMNCYGNGRGTGIISVDHIDRNPLNNTLANLRLATCEEQKQNSRGVLEGTKRERQSNARELPDGLSQEDMPKYVTYNVNVYNKEQNKSREYFCIEGHPFISPKIWESSKSGKVSLAEKLVKTKEMIANFDNSILPESRRVNPLHVYFQVYREKNILKYDNRVEGKTKSMVIKDPFFDMNDEMQKQKQLYIFNFLIVNMYGEEYSIFTDDYCYYGPNVDENELVDENVLNLPRNITVYNEKGKAVISFQKNINGERITKIIGMSQLYDSSIEPTPEFLTELSDKLVKINREIIKKYGLEHAVMETTEEQYQEIKQERSIEIDAGYPTNVHTKTVEGCLYLEYNKVVNKKRMTTTVKLPKNYNKNKELHLFNQKITEMFGQENAIDLTNYPYDEVDAAVNIPPNMYVNLNCSQPYIFAKNGNTTTSMVLPERYDLQEQIDSFDAAINKQDTENTAEEYKMLYDIWKPDNISIMTKDGKYVLSYQKRTKEYKHSISHTLPKTAFNINLHMIELNRKIVLKYGENYDVFRL
jgi:hypothetical protein